MKRAVLFDLGGTLAAYYERDEFAGILRAGLEAVAACAGAPEAAATDEVRQRAADENHEAPDYRVRPLAGRLRRIFGLEAGRSATDEALCRAFLGPIFACARVYDDSLPALRQLRRLGVRTAIVSNTPWGSPADLWREEVARLGLADVVDCTVFCSDVGWRKPDPRPFQHALDRLGVASADSLFVGDNPRWDTAGADACGIDAILIDRKPAAVAVNGRITGLAALLDLVAGPAAQVR